MKKTIRLTESDLTRLIKRVIKEQTLINLSKTSVSTPKGSRLGFPEDGPSADLGDDIGYLDCKVEKPMDVIIKEVFGSLEKISQPSPSEKVKKYIIRLKNSMEGIGSTDDVYKVFEEIKDKNTMSSIIKNWKSITKSDESLYEWISDEMTIRWVVLYNILQKNKFYNVKFNRCIKNKTLNN